MAINYKNLELDEFNYQNYLKIDELLSLQHEVSKPTHHDEMFFIIIHQASELWFKEIMHETQTLVEAFREPVISRAIKTLKRMSAIMDLLVKQINLLSTLTPIEFAGFRDVLAPASGFQSVQFRTLEFTYGIRNPFFLRFFEQMPGVVEKLTKIQNSPSVYDEFIAMLPRFGYDVPQALQQRDFSKDRKSNDELVATLKKLYEAQSDEYHWTLLFEAMLDFDEKLGLWRATHMMMIERTIGHKKGTGGSEGFNFLKSRLHLKCFPELWEVRNLIGTAY